MINTGIIKALSSGCWLMQPEAALLYEAVVTRLINGENVQFNHAHSLKSTEAQKLNRQAKAVYTGEMVDPRFTDFSKAVPGSISVIPLQGVVMKEDYCGDPGITTLQKWMQEAEANANIIGHLLFVDSPGGSASGVEDFAAFIKQCKKPVVAYVDGMAASAGYWIASAASEIICSEKLCTLGSIGAFSTFYDTRKRYEMDGVRKIEVYAPQSGMKNKMFRDIVDGDTTGYATRFLQPLVADFITAVKNNRSNKAQKMNDAVFAGEIFNATESIENGLADDIAPFKTALKRVEKLAKQNQV